MKAKRKFSLSCYNLEIMISQAFLLQSKERSLICLSLGKFGLSPATVRSSQHAPAPGTVADN